MNVDMEIERNLKKLSVFFGYGLYGFFFFLLIGFIFWFIVLGVYV